MNAPKPRFTATLFEMEGLAAQVHRQLVELNPEIGDFGTWTLEQVIAALLDGGSVTSQWGVRGVIADDDTAVWWRRDEPDARECAAHFAARLPGETIEVVRRFRLDLASKAVEQ